ncbi:CCR4-associated factor 1, partial [Musa troglodytarum]
SVLEKNLRERLQIIGSLRRSFRFVAIDTEFTGFPRHASEGERYRGVKYNVGRMHLLQFGIALFGDDGNTPWPGYCRQFNFADFDPEVDACSPGSVEMLQRSGHDLQRNRRTRRHARSRCSDLLRNELFRQAYNSTHITFHAPSDACLIKMITGARRPNTPNGFIVLAISILGDPNLASRRSRGCCK